MFQTWDEILDFSLTFSFITNNLFLMFCCPKLLIFFLFWTLLTFTISIFVYFNRLLEQISILNIIQSSTAFEFFSQLLSFFIKVSSFVIVFLIIKNLTIFMFFKEACSSIQYQHVTLLVKNFDFSFLYILFIASLSTLRQRLYSFILSTSIFSFFIIMLEVSIIFKISTKAFDAKIVFF